MFFFVKSNTKDFTIAFKAGKNPFKFFTIVSNIFMGLISLILIPFDILSIRKNREKTPKFISIIHLSAVSSVLLTFLVVVFYLTPLTMDKDNILSYFDAFKGTNLFYHFLIPVFAFGGFVFFPYKVRIKVKNAVFGIIPMLIYSIFYISNVINNIENDFYHFVINGKIENIFYAVIAIYLITYLISLLIIGIRIVIRKKNYPLTCRYERKNISIDR